MFKNPETVGEWQEAVNGANFWLYVDSAIQYGLLQMIDKHGRAMKGSGVNFDRCVQIIEEGKIRGIVPNIKPEDIADKMFKKFSPTKYVPPGRRCKLPKDYFINILQKSKSLIK